MIYKELDAFTSTDKLLVAGRRAEEQMAHYLKRFFGNSDQFDVLNYLRIELGGEVAQLDHLVLHERGLVIIESKSVAGSVQIKDDGQWIRWFNKSPQGMRSPVTQAKMQAMLLRELLSKTVKQKGFFDELPIDVLVAISDNGTIQWPSAGALAEVAKADQVPERIMNAAGATCGSAALTSANRRAIAQFLNGFHKPLTRVAEAAREVRTEMQQTSTAEPDGGPLISGSAETKPKGTVPDATCRHCGGTTGQMEHGKFGYYFACGSCAKNSSLKFACPACGDVGRIRKQGAEFFAECKTCDASKHFHTNA